jgi:hypothetical protein
LYLSHIDEYVQLFSYLGSTAFIMFVNWRLYDKSVYSTHSLKELKQTHPRIYRWIVSRFCLAKAVKG